MLDGCLQQVPSLRQLLEWAEWQQSPSVFLDIVGYARAWVQEEPSDTLGSRRLT